MAITSFSLQNKLGKSWGCLSSPSAVQTYGLQRARLEDLHGCRSLADNQAGGTFQCKEFATAAPGANDEAFVVRSRRSRMSLSRSPPTIQITPMSFFLTGATQDTGINDHPIDLVDNK